MSIGLVLTLLLGAQDPISQANTAYSDCLLKQTLASLDDKQDVDSFFQAAQERCTLQKQAYRAAVVKSERSFGSNQSEAEKYADEEAQYVLSAMTTNYTGYLETHTRPAAP